MANNYDYDVFVSYKRNPHQDEWLQNHFLKLFTYFVFEEIIAECQRQPQGIFFDQDLLDKKDRQFDLDGITPGQRWRDRLKIALKRSRCMVALWSPSYFRSDWCNAEWRTFDSRGTAEDRTLLIGVSVYDGKSFPPDARALQMVNLADYNIIGDGFTKTDLYVEFQQALKTLAHHVAVAVSQAPEFTDWPVVDSNHVFEPALPKLTLQRL